VRGFMSRIIGSVSPGLKVIRQPGTNDRPGCGHNIALNPAPRAWQRRRRVQYNAIRRVAT